MKPQGLLHKGLLGDESFRMLVPRSSAEIRLIGYFLTKPSLGSTFGCVCVCGQIMWVHIAVHISCLGDVHLRIYPP